MAVTFVPALFLWLVLFAVLCGWGQDWPVTLTDLASLTEHEKTIVWEE